MIKKKSFKKNDLITIDRISEMCFKFENIIYKKFLNLIFLPKNYYAKPFLALLVATFVGSYQIFPDIDTLGSSVS